MNKDNKIIANEILQEIVSICKYSNCPLTDKLCYTIPVEELNKIIEKYKK